jgi:hypothetical protein
VTSRRTLLVLAACAAAALAQFRAAPGLSLGFRHEQGVETRLVLAGSVVVPAGSRVELQAAAAAGVLDNPGIAAYGVGAGVVLFEPRKLHLAIGLEHEQWNDWQAGENRVLGMLAGCPVRSLELGVGAMRRAPVFDPTRYASPFHWTSAVPEWNLLYFVDWTFLRPAGAELALRIANQGLLQVHNPQQFPFCLRGMVPMGSGWRATALVGSAVNGFSGPMITFSELDAQLGVNRGL